MPKNNAPTIDISLLITFHNESVLAHATLNSIEHCRQYAQKAGLRTEYIWVLDDCDAQTKNILLNHPAIQCNPVKIVEVNHQDLGLSRNSGLAVAEGTARERTVLVEISVHIGFNDRRPFSCPHMR